LVDRRLVLSLRSSPEAPKDVVVPYSVETFA
jgi:hypothetical protein